MTPDNLLNPAKDFPCERKGRSLSSLPEIPDQAPDEGHCVDSKTPQTPGSMTPIPYPCISYHMFIGWVKDGYSIE